MNKWEQYWGEYYVCEWWNIYNDEFIITTIWILHNGIENELSKLHMIHKLK